MSDLALTHGCRLEQMRVFCIEFTEEPWASLVRLLAERHGWSPSYWTYGGKLASGLAAQFPDCIFHRSMDAVRGLAPPAGGPVLPPDAEILDGLAETECLALNMMTRMDADARSFTYAERRRHYLALVGYWNGVLERLDPDLVMFPMSPHVVYDLVLYGLCKHRGVPTAMFDRCVLPGRVIPVQRFEQGSPELRRRYARALEESSPRLSDEASTHLRSFATAKSAVAPNFERKMKRLGLDANRRGISRSAGLRLAWHELKRFAYLLAKGGKPPETYLKLARRPVGAEASLASWQMARIKAIVRKRRLRKTYDALAREADLSLPYVLYALHYQPERATMPLSGSLSDQSTVVALLSSALPRDWKLYVKEHPWQLQSLSRGEMERDVSFYESIASHPNVQLVPMQADTSDLVRGARAVVTATGSTGWEALCRGVPAILFGQAWYADCRGAFRIRSRDDLLAAIERIGAGYRVPEKHVRAFLSAVEAVAARALLEPSVEVGDEEMLQASASEMAAKLVELCPEGAPSSREELSTSQSPVLSSEP